MLKRIEQDGLIVMGIVKGCERYVLTYAPDQANGALRTIGKWAANPELSFTWYDAAVVTKEIVTKEIQQHIRAARQERGD